MEVREIAPSNFLLHRSETTVSKLGDFIPKGQELIKEAVQLGLHVSGPLQWHYVGFTGDESKPFTLEVSLPVNSILPEYDGQFHFKTTTLFKCVSCRHDGSWSDLPKAYGRIVKFTQRHNLRPTAVSRELYILADLEHPENSITEIQFGVQ